MFLEVLHTETVQTLVQRRHRYLLGLAAVFVVRLMIYKLCISAVVVKPLTGFLGSSSATCRVRVLTCITLMFVFQCMLLGHC